MVINEGEIGGGDSIQYLFWNEREREFILVLVKHPYLEI